MINSLNSKDNNITSPTKTEEEKTHEQNLRTLSFKEFVGQKDIIDNLKIFIKAAQRRN